MKATSIGHAGMLIETTDGSIVCDPWFLPAFRGSWCVFPRNDQLSSDLMDRIENPDYLYISHIHGDHLDEMWLPDHINRDATVLIPGFPTNELERRMRALGFANVIRTVDGEEIVLNGALRIAIHCETSITDGPGGDSAIVVSDEISRLVNQNDCRTTDLGALRSHGPIDLHWIQYSGAIWYPMVYDETPQAMRELVDAKVESQFMRAMRYVEALDARCVVPSAGPPAFLDPDLFHLNMITGDELSIFPDQRSFMTLLEASNREGILAIPGTEIELRSDGYSVTHPIDDDSVARIFNEKLEYLRTYQADWLPWIQELKTTWAEPTEDLIATLAAWWEPLLAIAPTLRKGIDDICVVHAGDLAIAIDFRNGTVREWANEPHGFSFHIDRRLVETVVGEHAVDWSNSLFLSCRFTAWRSGPYNEFVYNFFKSLSDERMRRTEAEALRKLDPDRGGIAGEEIRIGEYIVERTCPHRRADLRVFGEIDGDNLVCTLHGWRFNLETGKCVNAEEQVLRVRRAESSEV